MLATHPVDEENGGGIRDSVMDAILQVISCKHYSRGHAQFYCSNKTCSHQKRVPFSCKNRMCNSCGKMQTAKWIEKQKTVLPPTRWQHVTFSMPSCLWPFFEYNRNLLGKLCKLGADIIKEVAQTKGVMPGIFLALHTFGRDLKWNCHLHISTTQGGLVLENNTWKNIYFKANLLMRMWRYRLITLLRKTYKKGLLTLPPDMSPYDFNQLLASQYKKYWHVHCAKPCKNPKKDIEYLGRYIKRPPIANSRLVHYNGTDIMFRYHDHKSGKSKYYNCDHFDFITRFIQHIPDKRFRIIRYYGFLSNRHRSKLLPIVNRIFNNDTSPKIKMTWRFLYKKTFGINPTDCIVCNSKLRLGFLCIGYSTFDLKLRHSKIAQNKIIR